MAGLVVALQLMPIWHSHTGMRERRPPLVSTGDVTLARLADRVDEEGQMDREHRTDSRAREAAKPLAAEGSPAGASAANAVTLETSAVAASATTTASTSAARFALTLRAYRERTGQSQNGLARAVDVSPSTVNMLESGDRRPTRDLVLRLGRALDLQPTDFDLLLDSAGFLPTVYDQLPPTDPDLLLVARVLADVQVPEPEKTQLRALLRLATMRWHPLAARLSVVVGCPSQLLLESTSTASPTADELAAASNPTTAPEAPDA